MAAGFPRRGRGRWSLALAIAATSAALIWAGTAAGGVGAADTDRAGTDRAEGAAKRQRTEVMLQLVRRQAGLQRLARAVSDPASRRYGRYVRPEQLASRFGARKSTRKRVRRFFRRRGLRVRIDVTGSFAQALLPARRARRMFGPIEPRASGRVPRRLRRQVRAAIQVKASPGQSLLRAGARGSAPSGGAAAQGSTQAGGGSPPTKLEPPYVRTGTPAGCEQGRNARFDPGDGPPIGPAFTPNQIQTAYGASRLHAEGVTGEGVRAGVLIDGFARRELRGFTECFGIEMPPTALAKVGRKRVPPTEQEAALDLQMLTLIAPGLERLVVYSVGSGFFPAQFAATLDRRNAPDRRLPDVLSVSQGECESDIAPTEIRLTERVLAAAAAAGVTVAAGSGDSGAFCTSGKVGFYPGSSRWATSVGGSALTLRPSNRIADEVVWNDVPLGENFAGGGGFSSRLATPFFQRGIASWGPRRGYPDVAQQADGYPGIAVYCGLDAAGNCDPERATNPFQAIGNGTSAATPLFAGAVALANQRRLDSKAPPLGFANPLIYELGAAGGGGALRDIVDGSNSVFASFDCCQAGPGYDLASGWGSVDAAKLAAAAVARAP